MSRCPINSVRLRCNTSSTIPCMRRPPSFFILTRTVSPCNAVLKSSGLIRTSVFEFSTITNPIPERVISRIPFKNLPASGCDLIFSFFEFFLPIFNYIFYILTSFTIFVQQIIFIEQGELVPASLNSLRV